MAEKFPNMTDMARFWSNAKSYIDGLITTVQGAIAAKQDALVSGTNIKTVGGNSLLGSGNITPANMGAAASSHNHAASDINSGTLDIARIPTGTGSSQVALGNHTHSGYQATLVSGTNIKTVNGESLLGSGNITVSGSAATPVSVTLPTTGWSSNAITVNVSGVTANSSVIVSPHPEDLAAYAAAGIWCSAQGAGTLTFGRTSANASAIRANVLVMGA